MRQGCATQPIEVSFDSSKPKSIFLFFIFCRKHKRSTYTPKETKRDKTYRDLETDEERDKGGRERKSERERDRPTDSDRERQSETDGQ